jgi:transcriptional regulator with XRE-family HTH domain
MPNNFVEMVTKIMEEEGVSQAELARRLNVSRSAVNQFFQGEFLPSVTTMEKYLEALGHKLVMETEPVVTTRRQRA